MVRFKLLQLFVLNNILQHTSGVFVTAQFRGLLLEAQPLSRNSFCFAASTVRISFHSELETLEAPPRSHLPSKIVA